MNVVQNIPGKVRIKNALVSVYDKTGLDEFITALLKAAPGVKIYSTGGTYKAIEKLLGAKAEGTLIQVSDYTGQPEMQGGLVKTLDYKIYLGLLSEPVNPEHDADLARVGAIKFDLTVVNLYPFGQASTAPGASLEVSRSFIDIGGPTMLRASAKNYLRVSTLVDPADYGSFIGELSGNSGQVSLETRIRLAEKVFTTTARYDSAIAAYLTSHQDGAALSCYTIQ